MKHQILTDADEILDRYVTGYHEYILDEPAHLTRVSKNLCDLLRYKEDDLLDPETDFYLPLVHPADSRKYRCFLDALKKKESTQTLEYRLVKRSGAVVYVKDTMSSKRLPDGRMAGFSVLADITSLEEETENVRMISETVPCGLLRYTCEATPRVTYVNNQMIQMMRVLEYEDSEIDELELYRSNIYLMIAPESRSRFSRTLQSVYMSGEPYAGEISVIKGDGSKGRLFGWVTKQKNSAGEDEFQSICMDVTKRYEKKKTEQGKLYLKAISEVYDLIFEFDKENNTVRYLHGDHPYLGDYLEGIPMQLQAATEKWLNKVVVREDAHRVRNFLFASVFRNAGSDNGPSQISFRYMKKDGTEGAYQAVLLKAGPTIIYFCCKEVQKEAEAEALRQKNDSLEDQNRDMQEIVRRFTDGVVAFEIDGKKVRPLYVSDNAYAFFGYSQEEWAEMARDGITIREFVAGTGVSYGYFEDLFRTGEAEFAYTDVATGTTKKVKAVCSGLETGPGEKKYVMLYRADEKAGPEEKAKEAVVQIRTFGYFDVFVNGKPIMFKTEKAKELLAVLVDRKGGYVTPDEAISILWEDEPAEPVVLARYRKVALRLRNQLEEYGVSGIVESVNGKRRLVTELVDCDLYRYLDAPEENQGLFRGSYLTNYSWGETTLGELIENQ